MGRKGQHRGYSKCSKWDEWLKKNRNRSEYYVVNIITNQQMNIVSCN